MTPAEAPYQRVAREVADQVRTGRLKPGDALPGAPLLGEQHGVSKATAQKAINLLKAAGVLESVVGVGITVTSKTPPQELSLESLAATLREHEDRIGAVEAAIMDVYATIGRPRPKGGTGTRNDREGRGNGRTDRSAGAAGA
ncbi:MAG TPA: winged helix-turn-helix domain-containing protein [Kineosporiaceae bacterium]